MRKRERVRKIEERGKEFREEIWPKEAAVAKAPPKVKEYPDFIDYGSKGARVKVSEPCGETIYRKALELMQQGMTVRGILKASGAVSWDAIKEHGMTYYPKEWPALSTAHIQARALRMADKAQAVFEQEECAVVTDSDGPKGSTHTEQKASDGALMHKALIAIDPATYGPQAGKTDVKVMVPIQVVVQDGDMEGM